MAHHNIADWSPDQVADWLRGLDPAVSPYIPLFLARKISGPQLLTFRSEDLESLGVLAIGHQEILVEAIEHLRNFHYGLASENIQQFALRLACEASSLCAELRAQGGEDRAGAGAQGQLSTARLSEVAQVVGCVKPLAWWLERRALASHAEFSERRAALLRVALEAATCAQRDRFADRPAPTLLCLCRQLVAIADYFIQEAGSPLVLQTATVESVVVRRRGAGAGAGVAAGAAVGAGAGARALGLELARGWPGHCHVAHVKFGSAAHAAAHLHSGDQILQVGGTMVVGWDAEAVSALLEGAGGEVSLAVARRGARGGLAVAAAAGAAGALRAHRLRPFRPIRRPWAGFDTPSPPPAPSAAQPTLAPALTVAPAAAQPPDTHSRVAGAAATGDGQIEGEGAGGAGGGRGEEGARSSSEESEALSPPASPALLAHHPLHHSRLYQPKPRALLQRRYTISGSSTSPTATRSNLSIEQFWQELKDERRLRAGAGVEVREAAGAAAWHAGTGTGAGSGAGGRDKAASCSAGLHLPAPASPAPPACAASATSAHSAHDDAAKSRGKLDKSHSTPAYDCGGAGAAGGGGGAAQPIPESPGTPPAPLVPPAPSPPLPPHSSEKADQILNFKKSSSQIGEAIQQKIKIKESFDKSAIAFNFPDRIECRNLGILVESVNNGVVERARARAVAEGYPVLRAVGAASGAGAGAREPQSPLKPIKHMDGSHISLPVPHPARLLTPPHAPAPSPTLAPMPPSPAPAPLPALTLTPDARLTSPSGAVRSIFPSSKSKNLKKKNSLLAKGRSVSAREVMCGGGVACAGPLLQRCRPRPAPASPAAPAPPPSPAGTAAALWDTKWYVLRDNALYGFKHKDGGRAECLILLAGFTVARAPEVKSKQFAFKVYHTGTALYLAAPSQDALRAWLPHLTAATLAPTAAAPAPAGAPADAPHGYYSETDCSDSEPHSDHESPLHAVHKDKDKSKFNSLKKLTTKLHKTDSHENVTHSATSLDRKYLKFFSSKHRLKEKKARNEEAAEASRRAAGGLGAGLPEPIDYIHASNPNLMDFEKSNYVSTPTILPPKANIHRPENFIGFVTLEEFMLRKQEEERQQVYSNRVLMGIEKETIEEKNKKTAEELKRQLEKIIPDVIYGELPTYETEACNVPTATAAPTRRSLPDTPDTPDTSDTSDTPHRTDSLSPLAAKPISVKGKDGYEKIVYIDSGEGSSYEIRDGGASEGELAVRARDLGYELLYDAEGESAGGRGHSPLPRRKSEDMRKPMPPPRIMPKSKQVLRRQHSLTNCTSRVELVPGDCAERVWIKSLRRSDKVRLSNGAPAAGGPAPASAPPVAAQVAAPGPAPTATQHRGRTVRAACGARTPVGGASCVVACVAGGAALQYPPTFEPETYSLSAPAPAWPPAPLAPPAPPPRRPQPAAPPPPPPR